MSQSHTVGEAFAAFHEAVARAERWKRVSRFLSALSKRHTIEVGENGWLVGNTRLSEGEVAGISRENWDGSPEHADELVGDYIESWPT